VLKYLDVLIGLALVMLIAATVALSISHALLDLLSSRARHLEHALDRLVRQIHPAVLGPHAPDIARLVLLHPLVGMPHGPLSGIHNWARRTLRRILPDWLGRYLAFGPRMPARVILREEFALCLFEWASPGGSWSMQFDDPEEAKAAARCQTALVQALRERGIEDPAATLKAVKLQAMVNERDHPEQSAETWRSQALAQCAPSEFLSGLYVAFDTTMNRATTSFGREAQAWVSVVALVMVVVAELDAVHLIKRLSIDDAYRATLVADAQQLTADIGSECAKLPSGCSKPEDLASVVTRLRGGSCDPSLPEPELTRCRVKTSAALLSAPALDLWPDTGTSPSRPPDFSLGLLTRAWPDPSQRPVLVARSVDWVTQVWPKLPGILLAWILVSLGAPFWYDLLKNLFKLRSLLAQKDDADRGERNAGTKPTATIEVNKGVNGSTPAPASSAPAPSAAPVAATTVPATPSDLDGEMGDLLATGARG
jgi:hypothetical protein